MKTTVQIIRTTHPATNPQTSNPSTPEKNGTDKPKPLNPEPLNLNPKAGILHEKEPSFRQL